MVSLTGLMPSLRCELEQHRADKRQLLLLDGLAAHLLEEAADHPDGIGGLDGPHRGRQVSATLVALVDKLARVRERSRSRFIASMTGASSVSTAFTKSEDDAA